MKQRRNNISVLKINFLIFLMIFSIVFSSVQATFQQTTYQATHQAVENTIHLAIADEGESHTIPSIIVGPYAQHADLTSIIITWQTNIQTTENKVYWGIPPSCDQVIYQSYTLLLDIPNVHVVKIEDLLPSTQYCYRVVSDGGVSAIQTFTTALDDDQTLHFVTVGDTQQGNDPLYTYNDWYQNVTRIANGIDACAPDLVLHMGDVAFYANDPTHWNQFFNVSTYLTKSVFYPAVLHNYF